MPHRLMMWNIRHGGDRRVPQIVEVIRGHRPEVLVLTEFRNDAVAPELCAGLQKQRLKFQAAPPGPSRELSVLIASRFPFRPRTRVVRANELKTLIKIARLSDEQYRPLELDDQSASFRIEEMTTKLRLLIAAGQ